MKVSIVTPSFNQVAFLEETILSVLNQTYADLEYIVIDGGSTDGSVEIIKKYADRLTYWESKKDNGQAHAINKGYEKCTGEIFAYLNSDDMLEPDAVAKIVEGYSRHPDAAVVYGQCSTIDGKSKIIHAPRGATVEYYWLLQTGMLPRIYQPACFFNMALISRKPVVKESLQYVMDYELLLFLLRKHPSYFLNSPIARYRVHDHAKTTRQTSALYREKLRIQREYGINTAMRSLKHSIKNFLFRG